MRTRLALFFAVVAVPKLAQLKPLRATWRSYGLPGWTLPFTGAIELTTAAALSRPSTARAGGALSLVVLSGATLTNLRRRWSWPLIAVCLGLMGPALKVMRDAAAQETP